MGFLHVGDNQNILVYYTQPRKSYVKCEVCLSLAC